MKPGQPLRAQFLPRSIQRVRRSLSWLAHSDGRMIRDHTPRRSPPRPRTGRAAGPAGPRSPSRPGVRPQLEPILASAEFAGPERARRFLRYVVEKALAGRGERIKAYTIAVEVLGRADTFDANADPAVRLEA